MRKITLNVFSFTLIILFSVVAGMNIILLFLADELEESPVSFVTPLIVLIIVMMVIIRGNIRKYQK